MENKSISKMETCSNTILRKYVEMARDSSGIALQNVIVQALEANGLYVFAELLNLNSVKEMETDAMNMKYWKLLNTFTYGTLQTYKEIMAELPPLSPLMAKKLQLLTLMTLAADNKFLSYESLSKELCVENPRELENLLISAIYEEVIKGRLDQLNSRLEIHWSAGRDVKPNDMMNIIETLTSWCSGCEKVLTNIEQQVVNADQKVAEENKKRDAFNKQIESLTKDRRKPSPSTPSLLLYSSSSQQPKSGSGQPLPTTGVNGSSATGAMLPPPPPGENKNKKSKVKQFRSTGVKSFWNSKNL